MIKITIPPTKTRRELENELISLAARQKEVKRFIDFNINGIYIARLKK